MHRPITLSVVMPVFNEVMTVVEAIDRVIDFEDPDFSVELIIVESNSTDGTREIVDKYCGEPNVCVIRQDQPRGKGHAVRAGLGEATGQIVLIQDADLEYDVSDYPKLVEPILAGEADFVLGSRHSRGEPIRIMPNEPLASAITNAAHWAFLTLFNLTYQVRLHDPFTMYKVFRAECVQDAYLVANRFDFDWELVGKMIRLGYIPMEIPVRYRARGFRAGKKIRLLKDPITWLVACFRFRFGRLLAAQ
jgi:glycosyltransferase involved in cell wall biosynthesis